MGRLTFGQLVRELRTSKKIGSREMSRKIEMAETYISQLERNQISRPDYKTAYKIMKILGEPDMDIEEFLYNGFSIKSPEHEEAAFRSMALQAEMEEEDIEREIRNLQDPAYQEYQLEKAIIAEEEHEKEIQWVADKEKELIEKNTEINKELVFFINKRFETFVGVIENMHSLIMSMSKNESDYKLFTSIFKSDLTKISEEGKQAIINLISDEYEKAYLEKEGKGMQMPPWGDML